MGIDAFIYDAVRTPRGKGKVGGALYETKPIDLVKNLLDAIEERNQLDKHLVEDLILATGEPVDEQGQNIAKTALVYADWADTTTGAQLHRYCAGGLDAVNNAAAKVKAGFEDLVLAGGVESMSRLGIGASGAAAGDPWVAMNSYGVSQGVGADLLATLMQLSRNDLDEYALQSQQRAAHAWQNHFFNKSIVPVTDFNGVKICERDELLRPDTSMQDLGKLTPSFQMHGDFGHADFVKFKYPQIENIQHLHTPGNSSGIVDGASLVLIGNQHAAKKAGLSARARIRACALVGSEPTIMLTGPVPAAEKALAKAGMTIDDIDLFELNEAFASMVLHFQRELNIQNDKLNVNGGAIAMGHPIGATGAMILGSLLDELERQDLQTGMAVLCAGGGIGIATIIERV